MEYTYPAVFKEDAKDKSIINVFFPDFLGVYTFGVGMQEATAMAKEALVLALISGNYKNIIPTPSQELNFELVKLIKVEIDE